MTVSDLFYRKPGTLLKSVMTTRVDKQLATDVAAEKAWRAVCKVVDARDGRACRACGRRSDPEAMGLLRGHRHHIVYRSAGGLNTSDNLCVLCASCHSDEHVKRTLRVEGNADVALTFWKKDLTDCWYVFRQEVAVRQFERD